MSSCESTPTRTPARPASGREVAPPPHPTSSTRPPSGSRSSARTVVGVGSGCAGRLPPLVRKSSVGKPYGDSGAAAMISAGIAHRSSCSRHRSIAVTTQRRISSVCSPRSGGACRVSRTRAVEPDGIANETERRRPSRVDHRLDECSSLGRSEDLVHRADRGARAPPQLSSAVDPLGRGPGRERLGEELDQVLAMAHPLLVRDEATDRRPTRGVPGPRTFCRRAGRSPRRG